MYEPRSMSFAVVTDLAVKPAKGAYAQLCWVVQHNAVNDSRALNMMNGTTVGVRCASCGRGRCGHEEGQSAIPKSYVRTYDNAMTRFFFLGEAMPTLATLLLVLQVLMAICSIDALYMPIPKSKL